MMRLENWFKDADWNILWGCVYDDPDERWPEGTRIHTSDIRGLQKMEIKEGDTVVTRNSIYLLGKPLTIDK